MSTNGTSLKRTLRALRASVLVAFLATPGLVGCSSGEGTSGGGGSAGKSSAGQSGGSGGASGGQSSQAGSSSSVKGGSSSSSSSAGSGGGGQSSDGTSSAGGSLAGGSRSSSSAMMGGCPSTCTTNSSTGGIGGIGGTGRMGTGGTGGTATGGSSQGGQDGGAGSSGSSSSSPDAGVDRTPDIAAPNPDTGSAGDFCPSDGTACKIMPFGDSITDGVGSSGGGYRVPLFKLALTDSKNITFVGAAKNGPASVTVNGQTKPFPQSHEGHSGWTIKDGGGRDGIYDLVDETMRNNTPHIVLLMIGTNDVNINLDLTNAPKRLGELLDKIIADAPKALVVVAKLVPTTNDGTNGRVRTYNDGIATEVQSRISAGKNLKMVDMYAAFTSNTSYKTALMNDELHPKDAGYSVMAQTWYDAIKQYLH